MTAGARPRDLVYQTLRREQPAVCPYYIWVSKEMVAPLAEHYGAKQFIGHAADITIFAGSYTALKEIVALDVSEDGDRFVDEYGTHFRRANIKQVE